MLMQLLRATLLTITLITSGILYPCFGQDKIYVSDNGSDKNDGTLKYPVQHLTAALF